MKLLNILLSLICLTALYSCGGASSTNSASAASSTSPITQNGISSTAAGVFTGTWSGYLDSSYTTITILANGNITISAVGESTVQRILVLQNKNYFIVNSEANTGVLARVSGNVLIVRVNGVDETFSKN